jgi:hypothetical protein
MRKRFAWTLLVSLLATAALIAQSKAGRPTSGSLAYSRLKEKQRDLFDRWAAAQRQAPAQAYEQLTISQRTAYEGITHALTRTKLTDQAGKPIGAAIDLVASLDGIAGEDKGKRGDQQFRIYVRMAPDAERRLIDAREFRRDKDNTIFHKDYPLNYRQHRFPSIQVSMSRDAVRGDIDVDYRSSRPPQGLFNGHLTSANSDIRAGGNYLRHIFRWTGLLNWWPLFRAAETAPAAGKADVVEADLPETAKIERVEDAAQEFFNDWLVRAKTHSSRLFYAPDAVACLNTDEDPDNEKLDAGHARTLFVEMLDATTKSLGRQKSLTTAIEAVAPWDLEMKVVRHANEAFFTLVSVGDDDAAEYMCAKPPPRDAKAAAAPQAYGTYFETIFAIKAKNGQGGGMSLLWKRENGAWRIVSYDDLDP